MAINSKYKTTLPSDNTIFKVVSEASYFPLPVRIAAWYLRSGGDEQKWAETMKRLSHLPEPLMVAVQNSIRDINRDMYGQSWRVDIPPIAIISMQRTEPLTAEEAAEYSKIRAKVEQDLPDLIARHHVRMISQDGAEEYKNKNT